MNRLLTSLVTVLVITVIACICMGALLFIVAQVQPVAPATLPPASGAAVVQSTPLPPPTSVAVNTPDTQALCNNQGANVPSLSPSAVPPVAPVVGQTQTANGITVSLNKYENQFPKQLLFSLQAQDSNKITQVALVIAINGQSSTSRQVPTFTPDTSIDGSYKWNLVQNYLPPGAGGQFWWTVQDSAGNQLQTTKLAFSLEDPQHTWKKLANDKLALFWYTGDDNFGQSLFDRANKAIQYLQQDTGVVVDQQVQIHIYGSHDELMQSLEAGAQEWTGGQNFPEYGAVMIGVAPSELDWGLGATTHELTHQVIHQKIKSPLGDLSMPHWMDEGLAVYYQTYPCSLDSQFAIPLRRAIQNDNLIRLRSLSSDFPADPAAADLSYAESYSVVDFIIRHFGRQKLTEILQGFKTGGYYDDIFKKVLGMDTDGLENVWRQDVGAQPHVFPTVNAATPSPFPTFGLSTDNTPTPGP